MNAIKTISTREGPWARRRSSASEAAPRQREPARRDSTRAPAPRHGSRAGRPQPRRRRTRSTRRPATEPRPSWTAPIAIAAEAGLDDAERERDRASAAEPGLETVGEVVAARGDDREAGAAPRDRDERRVEDGDADEQYRREQVLEAKVGRHRERHQRGRQHEADRKAAPVAEEDAGRRGEVVGEKAEAGPGQSEGEDRRAERRPRSGQARRSRSR